MNVSLQHANAFDYTSSFKESGSFLVSTGSHMSDRFCAKGAAIKRDLFEGFPDGIGIAIASDPSSDTIIVTLPIQQLTTTFDEESRTMSIELGLVAYDAR